MEEIKSVAQAYYDISPEHIQQTVKDFFRAMNVNRNGFITVIEFTNYMIRNYPQVCRSELFMELDGEGKGCLSFKEVITLWFMLNVRNFCNGKGCRRILASTFYVCTSCFHDLSKQRWFALCVDCYAKKNHGHEHEEFLDHYCLLSDAWWELRAEKVCPHLRNEKRKIVAICGNYRNYYGYRVHGPLTSSVSTFSNQGAPSQVRRNEKLFSKCKLLNWHKKVVAEGILESVDPKVCVHRVPIGTDNWKVRVDTALDPEAVLWKPTSNMSIIEHVVGISIAWHKDFISFD